jgi:hypothetical protein
MKATPQYLMPGPAAWNGTEKVGFAVKDAVVPAPPPWR